MKKSILFVAALALGAAVVSCEKPLEELNPSFPEMTADNAVVINSGEAVNIKFALNDVRGNAITADYKTNAVEQYDIAVKIDPTEETGTVTITPPALILDDTPFDIDITFTDQANARQSSAKITVKPALVSGLVKFTEPANTFIVAPGAIAVFPTSKGNSGTNVAPASIKVEWQDNAGLFVDAPKVENGEAIVRFAEGKEGNVVLDGVDASGNVVWSWLFWVVSDTPKDVTVGGSTFMDRNVGAISLDEKSELSVGVIYQYGRKDPFPGLKFDEYALRTIYDGTGAEKTVTITKNEEQNNLENTIKNPGVFYNNVYVSGAKHGYSWLTVDASQFPAADFKALWDNGGQKSMYDPCPAGYKVAAKADWEGVKSAQDVKEIWDSSYETFDDSSIGTNDKYAAGNRKKVQFRGCSYDGLKFTVTGEVNSNSDKFSFANCIGKPLPTAVVWSADIDPDFESKLNASYFRGTAIKLNTSGNGNYDDVSAVKVNPLSTAGKYNLNYALPVRCVKE
ncbi:MAG: hypothetical protein MJY84_08200 [Bacteroidales bacterium]|nr:hypothetical protein [Bacteroidales bacterium]